MRILLWVSVLVGSLVATAVALGFAILLWPSLVLNQKTLSYATKFAAKEGWNIQWKNASVQARSIGIFHWEIEFDWRDLEVRGMDGELEAHSPRVRLGFRTRWKPGQGALPRVEKIAPFQIADAKVRYRPVSAPDPRQAPGQSAKESPVTDSGEEIWFTRVFRDVQLNDLSVKVVEWSVEERLEKWDGRFSLDQAPHGKTKFVLSTNARRTQKKKVGADRVRADLELVSLGGPGSWEGPWELDGRARYHGAEGIEAGSKIILRQTSSDRMKVEVSGSMEAKNFLAVVSGITGEVQGHQGWLGLLDPKAAKIQIRGSYRDFRVQELVPRRITTKDCQIDYLRLAAEKNRVTTDCPVEFWMSFPLPSDFPEVHPPRSVRTRLHAEIETEAKFPDPASKTVAQVQLDLEALSVNVAKSGPARVDLKWEGIPSEFPETGNLQAKLEAGVEIPDFQRMVQLFAPTAFAVPAPLNALDGTIQIEAQGHGGKEGFEIPIMLRTDLHSKGGLAKDRGPQHFVSRTEAVLRFQDGFTGLDSDTLLENFAIALPRLELKKPPQFVSDSRIKTTQEKVEQRADLQESKDEASKFRWKLRLRTHEGQPLRIISNLAKREIPVQLNLVIDDQGPPQGLVRIDQFPLKLFNRDAEIERFDIDLKPERREWGESKGKVKGQLKVTYADYVVRIGVSGAMERPEVELSSDPPLPEDQLYSVLVFGRPLEELEADEGASVGSTRAAVADGAVGFASLYLLASTPVESVGYDPSTGIFSAKIRLGEGTSLNVGGGGDQNTQKIGIKRRLSRHWTVSSDFSTTQTGTTTRSLSAFLEWVNRY